MHACCQFKARAVVATKVLQQLCRIISYNLASTIAPSTPPSLIETTFRVQVFILNYKQL